MKYTKEYWDRRFTNKDPEKIRNAIIKVYNSFPEECMPQGSVDPMYIMNVICKELGIGDGQGNFNLP